MDSIDYSLLQSICDKLADTDSKLTTIQIIRICNEFAAKFEKEIKHTKVASNSGQKNTFPNKRTALLENLECFCLSEQYEIIKYICTESILKDSDISKQVMSELYKRYGSIQNSENNDFFEYEEETTHWLKDYSKSYVAFNEAIVKYRTGVFDRNILDDLRLSFELLLKEILGNAKSLEKQKDELGKFLKGKEISKHIVNMYQTLIYHYYLYQNNSVKHDINFQNYEVEYIFELTIVMMRFLIKCKKGA